MHFIFSPYNAIYRDPRFPHECDSGSGRRRVASENFIVGFKLQFAVYMYMGDGDGGSSGSRGDARSSSGRQQIVFPIIPENQTADRLAIRNRANLYPFGPQCNPRILSDDGHSVASTVYKAALNEHITNKVDRFTIRRYTFLHYNFEYSSP